MPGLLLGVGLAAIAAVIHLVSRSAVRGDLDRNGAVGIRTRATRASDLAWRSGHQAAAPWLLAASVTGYGVGLLAVVAAVVTL